MDSQFLTDAANFQTTLLSVIGIIAGVLVVVHFGVLAVKWAVAVSRRS